MSKPNRRWYRPTPDRLIVGLLAAEGLLLAADRFGWFGLTPGGGWNVLLAVALVLAVLLIGMAWFLVSLLFRWQFQFSIRSLCVLMISVGIVSSWFAVKTRHARRQSEAVQVIREFRGYVTYDYQVDGDLNAAAILTQPAHPTWLSKLAGEDFLADVVCVELNVGAALVNEFSDVQAKHFRVLPKLQKLNLSCSRVTDLGLRDLEELASLEQLSLMFTKVTDVGLKHLARLTNLRRLDLRMTRVTEEGVAELQQALPACRILYLRKIGPEDYRF